MRIDDGLLGARASMLYQEEDYLFLKHRLTDNCSKKINDLALIDKKTVPFGNFDDCRLSIRPPKYFVPGFRARFREKGHGGILRLRAWTTRCVRPVGRLLETERLGEGHQGNKSLAPRHGAQQ